MVAVEVAWGLVAVEVAWGLGLAQVGLVLVMLMLLVLLLVARLPLTRGAKPRSKPRKMLLSELKTLSLASSALVEKMRRFSAQPLPLSPSLTDTTPLK